MTSHRTKMVALVAAGVGVAGVLLYAGTVGVLTGVVQPGPRASSALPTLQPSSAAPASLSPGPVVGGTTAPATIAFPLSLQLSAPSRDVLWAIAGGKFLFRSIDRGATWFQRPLPPSQMQDFEVSFVNDREGWILAAGPGTGCVAQSIELWHTSDGGSVYERMPVAVVRAIGESLVGVSINHCKAGLAFTDSLHGFLTEWSPNSKPIVFRTTDGGRSWQASQPLPDPPGFANQPVASTLRVGPGPIRAFGSTLLLQAFGNVLSGERHFVYRSVDGGASWTYAASVPIPSPVGFVTATRWVQPILPRQSQETTDGGATWHAYAADWGQAGPTPPVVIFPDADVGYTTTSRGGFQRTLDGGLHWTALRPPGQ